MLLIEEAARRHISPRLQIFASDLHEGSLDRAREGFYPGDIATDVSAERLARFFNQEDGGYRIRKEVRELVVFAPHNLLGDPPFSKLDLVACRNVLIYMQREVQHEIIDLFHYALRPGGVLVLGSSETVESSELFRVLDKPHCLYRKRNVPAPKQRLPVFPITRSQALREQGEAAADGDPIAYGALHQRMVEAYAPPSLLLSPDDKVVHLSEHAGRFLVHPGGEPTLNVFRLLRDELRMELRAAVHAARKQGVAHRTKPVAVRFGGQPTRVILDVRPTSETAGDGFLLVIFDELRLPKRPSPEVRPPHGEEDESVVKGEPVQELEAELDLYRQRLQAIIEEYETSQEEMKASNEELQSGNEELRSTLEELETSKEELQSMNEELQTVNQEHRHKVEELRLLSDDLQNLLTSTDIATLFLDRDLRILRYTPQVGELFNVRPADRGRPLADLTHRLGYQKLGDDARQVLAKLVPIERELEDEQGRWYLTRVLPYRSADDRIEGVVLTFVDITRRKEVENGLRESEERYRLLVESAQEYAILLVDNDGRVTSWNRGAERIFGYSEEEAIGLPFERLFTEDDRAAGAPAAEIECAIQTGRSADDRWHLRKDGERFWANGALEALQRPDGSTRGFSKLLRDNTERKAAEDALRQSEARLQLALQAAAIGTYEYDVAGDRHTMDERAREIIGADADFSFRGWVDAVHPEDREQIERAAAAALDPLGEGLFDEEYRISAAGGEERWVRASSRTLFSNRNSTGEPKFVFGAVQDLTSAKQIEQEREQLLRSAEESRAEAVAANLAKSEFLATMSHELRTPLNAVIGYSELLELGVPEVIPEPSRGHVKRIRLSTRHLLEIIEEMLAFTRLEAGRETIEPEHLVIQSLLDEVAAIIEPLAEGKGIVFRIEPYDGPERGYTDARKLRQILLNLLGNAVKFTSQGEVTLRVEQRNGELVVQVRDTGIGINPDQVGQLFEAFWQSDSSLSRHAEGTGLGLAIAQRFAEMLGGTIGVESTLGDGSTFTACVPLDGRALATVPDGG